MGFQEANRNTESAVKSAGSQTVDRALGLLRLVSEGSGPVSIGELCGETGLNRTTVWRLLASLENNGFLERDEASRGYQLGYAAVRLGMGVNRQYAPLNRIARPVMEQLREETGETVILSVPRFSGILTIDQVNSPQTVRLKNYVDLVVPLHCSSNGKVLLTFLEEEELERFLQGPLEQRTEKSVTDPVLLRRELEMTRKQGYGQVVGELDENENGISVPILMDGYPEAFLSICGPGFRLTREAMQSCARPLLEAGREVASRLTL